MFFCGFHELPETLSIIVALVWVFSNWPEPIIFFEDHEEGVVRKPMIANQLANNVLGNEEHCPCKHMTHSKQKEDDFRYDWTKTMFQTYGR